MTVENTIRDRLTEAFAPLSLDVVNESHRHAGHAGDDGSGESHWRVRLVSETFVGQGRIARHRAVHTALGADLTGRIHALALELRAPDEA